MYNDKKILLNEFNITDSLLDIKNDCDKYIDNFIEFISFIENRLSIPLIFEFDGDVTSVYININENDKYIIFPFCMMFIGSKTIRFKNYEELNEYLKNNCIYYK